jgi:hypothetical protein
MAALIPFGSVQSFSIISHESVVHLGLIAISAMTLLRWLVRDGLELYGDCRSKIRRWRR